jgi:hypothetical protein
VTGEGFSTVEACAPNLAKIDATAAGSPVIEQPGIEKNSFAFPNGVTRTHTSLVTRDLRLIKVSSPIAWLSQPWLLRRWQIGLRPGVASPKQINAGNGRNRQHQGDKATNMVQNLFPSLEWESSENAYIS